MNHRGPALQHVGVGAETQSAAAAGADGDSLANGAGLKRDVVDEIAAFLVVGVVPVGCGVVVCPQDVEQAAVGPRTEIGCAD